MTTTDGLRTGRDALLDPEGAGARLSASELRDALADLYEFELLDRASRAGIRPDTGYALVAFGGLGRREMLPYSDLDLVLVHDGRPKAELSEVADALWYPLWDAGIPLDHSVRTVDQCLAVAADDVTVALSLLEVRVVAGDADLGGLVVDGALRQWRQQIPAWFERVVSETEARRRRAGLIAHRMEPDLKNGAGGLRDVQLLDALAAANLTDGVPAPVPGAPGAGVEAAHRLVLDVRTELHRITGRSRDVLNAQYGDDVARALEVGDRFDLARDLSDAARTIAYATDVGVRTARGAVPRRGLSTLLRRSTSRRPLDEGVVEQGGEVVLARGVRVEREPGLVLRVGAAAARNGLPISAATLRKLADSSPEPRGPWPADALSDLLVLLGSGDDQIDVIEALDRSGLWGRLLPEWGAVRDLPARDRAHVFTVDRHLVQTAVEASHLTTSCARADLLLLAALVHDLGKGRDRDHSEVGAELADVIGRRIGLDDEDVETLSRVVRHHLLLAGLAQRRDPSDPATGDEVLRTLEGDTRAFDVLAALTEADSRATGPTVWGDWKARVHAELVATCRARIEATAHADVPPPEVPGSTGDGAGPLLEMRPTVLGNTHELICDLPGGGAALPATASLLAAHGLEIVRADLRVVRPEPGSGAGADPADGPGDRLRARMLVATRFGTPVDAGLLRQDLRRALDKGLSGQLRSALSRREKAAPAVAQAPASVRIRPRGDAPGTLIEVRTEDRPGLFGRVAEGVLEAGAELDWAIVRTRGAAVEDVLAVTGVGADDDALAARLEALLPPVAAEG